MTYEDPRRKIDQTWSHPSFPITDLKSVIKYIKMLSKSKEKHFPYTASRLRQVNLILKKVQQEQNRK